MKNFSALARLTALVAGLGCALSFLVCAGLVFSTWTGLNQQINASVNADIVGFEDLYEQRRLIGVREGMERRVSNASFANEDAVFLLMNRDGSKLGGNLSDWPIGLGTPTELQNFEIEGEPYRVTAFDFRGGFPLLVGRSLKPVHNFIATQIWLSVIAVAACGFLSAIAGSLLSRTLVRKLDALNAVASSVVSGNIQARVASPSLSDEFDALSNNVDDMLDAISTNNARMRALAEQIAHELRTPLNRINSIVSKLSLENRDGPTGTFSKHLEKLDHEVTNTVALFDTVLEIAATNAGIQSKSQFENVDVVALVERIVELYRPAAEDAGLELTMTGSSSAMVFGQPILLQQMIANLMENALKYASDVVPISVCILHDDGIIIGVQNAFEGSETLNSDDLLEMFRRGPDTKEKSGAGLGLPFVNAIAIRHAGKVQINAANGVFDIVVKLPDAST